MLASAEARRNNALREIDRHRSAYGGAIRRTLDEVEDVEFRDVESGGKSKVVEMSKVVKSPEERISDE